MGNIKQIELTIPNLGEAEDTEVIEISVNIGDSVNLNDPLIVLESEKAAMEVPSEYQGVIKSISIKEGDNVKEGSVFGMIEVEDITPSKSAEEKPVKNEPEKKQEKLESLSIPTKNENDNVLNAGPAVRKIARELEIDLTKIRGTGKNAMILKEDLKNFVHSLGSFSANKYSDLNALKNFGDYSIVKQSKIRKIGAKNLYESWTSIPHVTHFEEIDITSAEKNRKKINESSKIKITPLSYLVKSLALCLKEMNIFNSSLIGDGELMIRNYINIGIAIDTEDGLVVPCIKNADSLNETEIASQISTLAEKAKSKKLLKKDFEGSTFTISSLGALGGVGFTPIINPPEVAIIGISRAKKNLIKIADEITERTILPMSLSYDHRVINGADAGRFMTLLKDTIESSYKD